MLCCIPSLESAIKCNKICLHVLNHLKLKVRKGMNSLSWTKMSVDSHMVRTLKSLRTLQSTVCGVFLRCIAPQ